MKHSLRWLVAIGLLVVLAAVLAASLVVVDETEFAVVTSFGRIVASLARTRRNGPAPQGAVAARAQDRPATQGLRAVAA